MAITIRNVRAREILDSRGFPTVECEIEAEGGIRARAAVPSGASTGEGEALELRDGDKSRYAGKGVLKAVAAAQDSIAGAIRGKTFANPTELDRALLALDSSPTKSKLGANAILAVSLAGARALAQAEGDPLHVSLARWAGTRGETLPVPLMNILNGGKHADNGLAIQEFMIVPGGFARFSDALRAGVETFHALKAILHERGLATSVGDEGGFAPSFGGSRGGFGSAGPGSHEQAMDCVLDAIRKAGYEPGQQIALALDCAASEFADGPGRYRFEGRSLSATEMASLYEGWHERYPLVSIEDGLGEADWDGWVTLTARLGSRCQLVGDDLFVTNSAYLRKGIDRKAANAILIKVNQIGSLTETWDAMRMAGESRYARVVSHRSGETEDAFIADLAVATDCGQIKTGSASRSDRTAKYNQLLRIEEGLGARARYLGWSAFPGGARA